jgi:pimeloyl-ACP methyl ester carboxylesterase
MSDATDRPSATAPAAVRPAQRRAGAKATPPSRGPVLLLHGQPGGARDWERVIAALHPETRAIAINRPGWDGASEPLDLPGNAAAALRSLDARGIDRATIVGHSLGAAIAAWLAAHHPERVRALVLASPAANRDSLYALDRLLAAPVAGYVTTVAALAGVGLALAASPLRRLAAGGLSMDEHYLKAASRRLLEPASWRAHLAEQRALVKDLPALEQHLPRISAPTTILVGAGDRIVPVASARRLATQIPGAQLELVSGAGHLLPQRHPQRLAEVIAAALDDASPRF